MKYLKLRIAWSVAWGVACLLLVVLWVRSYFVTDAVISPGKLLGSNSLVTESMRGRTTFLTGSFFSPDGWSLHHEPMIDLILAAFSSNSLPPLNTVRDFQIVTSVKYRVLVIPHWCPVLILASVGTVPWIHWSRRFSLRTLLIAMTVAAIGLGWVVYAIRK